MIPILKERIRGNLDRAGNLVTLYQQVAGASEGRPSIGEADLLRAAVMFIHAALEDLLREIAVWKLPDAQSEVLALIPHPGGDGRSTKMTLGDLARYRGRLVDEVITKSVMTHLDRSSYNGVDDIAKLFAQIGLPSEVVKRLMSKYAATLEVLMARRHQIADRLDRRETSEDGPLVVLSLDREIVESWAGTIRGFADDLLEAIENPSFPPEGGAMNDLGRLKAKFEKSLAKTNLVDPRVEVFEDKLYGIFVEILSPTFEEMKDHRRQEMVWKLALDDFDEHDRRFLKFIFTESPSEYAEAFGKERLAEFEAATFAH